jgi:DNA-binding NarL/FixJ family response regulator
MPTPLILLVEDDEATRQQIAEAIRAQPQLALAGAVGSCREARTHLAREVPAILLTDLELPDGSGIELIRELRGLDPAALAMVITVLGDDATVIAAIEAGASGYLLKGGPGVRVGDAILELLAGGSPMTASIARAVLRLFRGRGGGPGDPDTETPAIDSGLTAREQEILVMVAKGFKFAEIADLLSISRHTVKTHVRHIYRKLEVDSRSTAIYEAISLGIVKPGG